MGLKIVGTGSALPERILSNSDLEKMVETSDEWIVERTGISNRHIAADDETVASLGAKAAIEAIKKAGLSGEDVDLILLATCSSKVNIPCVACQIQNMIPGCKGAAFDIGAACTGFITALTVAEGFLNSGAFKNVLVIGSEVLSGIVDYSDRGTCILFGDGAGAAVVQYSDNSFVSVLGADGSGKDALFCENGGTIKMDGAAIYKFAAKKVPEVIVDTLKKANIEANEIDRFILHQANKRIVEAISKKIGEPICKFPMNMSEVGNMSSASIPVLLDKIMKEDEIKSGEKVVLAGFGAGLTFGACVLHF